MNDINHSETITTKHNNSGTRRLGIWTFAWLTSTALLRFGAEYIWDYFGITLGLPNSLFYLCVVTSSHNGCGHDRRKRQIFI